LVLLWYVHLVAHKPGGLLAFPVDLNVYRDAGLIVRHVRPFYRGSRPTALYNWPGPPRSGGLKFTCALTGLLVSPISWDHHWVWMVLATPRLIHYARRARGLTRWT
jgi:hypothetical protein